MQRILERRPRDEFRQRGSVRRETIRRARASLCGRSASARSTLRVHLERSADESERAFEIAEHVLCADADDAEARAPQLAIAASVSGAPTRVNGAIDLDDELHAGREEVSDESPRGRHLPMKGNAELTIFANECIRNRTSDA